MFDPAWIKSVLPRGLYGRAALILIVPIVTIQLVVSSVFLQRHFEDVTRQLTTALSLDLNLILATWAEDGQETATRLAQSLAIEISPPTFDGGNLRYFYDLSGAVVEEVLPNVVPGVIGIDMREEDRSITILLRTPDGAHSFMTARRRVSAAAPHQLLVIMVATGALMTLVAYLFLRNQLRPIRRLAVAADAFGRGRSLPYRPSGATEVRSAGRAFLSMRHRIEQHIAQRTLLLSGVSHDLRTPLTRMKLSLGMMDETPEVQDLNADLEEMESLLNTFLDFVRSDTLDDPELVDPTTLAQKVVDDARRSGGQIDLEPSSRPISVEMRPLAVHRALTNLASNALRYGNQAIISVVIDEHHLRISIEDNGPGIPEDRRQEALQPFIRLDQARNQNRGSGVGLGLAIADDIARRHGGALELESSARLGGLKASLVLPR